MDWVALCALGSGSRGFIDEILLNRIGLIAVLAAGFFSCDKMIAIERCRLQKIRCRSRAALRANWREECCSLTVTSRQPPVDFRRTKI